MSDTFSLGGDPGSIKASGQTWKSFATSASSASSDIKSVDAASFQGDEGDTYRSKVNDDLPPRLEKTHEAWNQVGAALITYASTLEDLQSRLATLKTQHDSATQTASAKANDLEGAKSADKTHDQQQTEAKSKLKPGETLPPTTYSSGASAAQSQLNEANNAVQDTIDKANQVHSEHKTALNTCCNEIDDAKGKRFEKPPGFWGKLKDSVVDWVKDHADVLKQISGVLKIISAIAGVLAFIPVLAPIMGPIALAAGGAALLIDVGLKLITGEGSWASIGLDAALMLLPGAGKLLKPLIMGSKAGKVVNALGVKGLKALGNTKLGNVLSKLGNSRVAGLPGKALNSVNNAVAKGLRKVPGLNKLPAERVLTIKYKKGWTPEQRAALDMKVAQLNRLADRGQLLRTRPKPRKPNLRQNYADHHGVPKSSLPKDQHVDHIHDLQLGGADDVATNTQLLNGSVNSSAGSQINHQIKNDANNTAYDLIVTAERR
ncbi:MAG: putative T7SS-secreted protein [Nakamurella sp.]